MGEIGKWRPSPEMMTGPLVPDEDSIFKDEPTDDVDPDVAKDVGRVALGDAASDGVDAGAVDADVARDLGQIATGAELDRLGPPASLAGGSGPQIEHPSAAVEMSPNRSYRIDHTAPAPGEGASQSDSFRHGDAADRPAGPYSVGPDGQPSAELSERIDRHRPQGDNLVTYSDASGQEQSYRFDGTCGLASGAQALSDATSREITEQDVLTRATEAPHLVGTVREPSDGGSAALWGGTTQAGRDRILSDFGVETELGDGWDTEQLAERVESGDSVLASVSSGDLWDSDRATPSDGGTDHVVYVIGTVRDESGELLGFVVNDTGLPDGEGAGVVHDRATFERAWEDRGGYVNAIVKERSDHDR